MQRNGGGCFSSLAKGGVFQWHRLHTCLFSQLFYTAELENVYYSEKSDCFIVADIENNNVYLHSVIYKNYIPLFLKNLHTFLDKANF